MQETDQPESRQSIYYGLLRSCGIRTDSASCLYVQYCNWGCNGEGLRMTEISNKPTIFFFFAGTECNGRREAIHKLQNCSNIEGYEISNNPTIFLAGTEYNGRREAIHKLQNCKNKEGYEISNPTIFLGGTEYNGRREAIYKLQNCKNKEGYEILCEKQRKRMRFSHFLCFCFSWF
jgi:hypothetical protein